MQATSTSILNENQLSAIISNIPCIQFELEFDGHDEATLKADEIEQEVGKYCIVYSVDIDADVDVREATYTNDEEYNQKLSEMTIDSVSIWNEDEEVSLTEVQKEIIRKELTKSIELI